MGLHVSLEFTCFCAGVVALFANERLLSTVNQLFSSVCECVPFEMFSLSARIVTLLTPQRPLSCIIDVHEDINNLPPPFPSNHHIVIVSQCLMISWEKLFIDKIIRPKSKTYTVVQWQFFFLCGKCMRSILMNNRDDCRTICSAAIPFPVWQNPAKYHNKDDFWKPVVNCRTGKGNTKPNLRQTFLFMCFYCFSSVSCDLSERQQGNLYIIWLLYQVRRPVSIWVLPASRWAVPDIHTILVLFASGKWLLSLFSFFYRNCDHWAPFYLPTYH